jgi:hypothetical protein
MGNFILNFEKAELVKKLQKNRSQKSKAVEFEKNLKRYGLSENLHSFKNTP